MVSILVTAFQEKDILLAATAVIVAEVILIYVEILLELESIEQGALLNIW